MSTVPIRSYTVAEYLALERQSPVKHEFFAGEMFAMAGATEPHNLIVTNAVRELSLQLKKRRCKVYSNDMRLRIPLIGRFTYPDVVVICGEAEFEDQHRDTLLNPTVLFEVLSPSTEAYDRGRKFEHYRKLTSLREYVLISQDRCLVERYERQSDTHWVLSEVKQLDVTLVLSSIGCELSLAEIYDKVEFPPEKPDENLTD